MPHSPDYSDPEKQIIRDHYPKKSREYIEKLLPNRNWGSIINKAADLKVKRLCHKNAPWSKTDEEYLEENYPTGRSAEIIKRLKRKWPTIISKANAMKLKRLLCDGTGNQICPGRMYLISDEVLNDGELVQG